MKSLKVQAQEVPAFEPQKLKQFIVDLAEQVDRLSSIVLKKVETDTTGAADETGAGDPPTDE